MGAFDCSEEVALMFIKSRGKPLHHGGEVLRGFCLIPQILLHAIHLGDAAGAGAGAGNLLSDFFNACTCSGVRLLGLGHFDVLYVSVCDLETAIWSVKSEGLHGDKQSIKKS